MTGVSCIPDASTGMAFYMLEYIIGNIPDLDCHSKWLSSDAAVIAIAASTNRLPGRWAQARRRCSQWL